MRTRRQVLKGGLGLFALSTLGSPLGAAQPNPRRLRDGALKASRPLAATSFDPAPRIIAGFPVRSRFEGDDFDNGNVIPFHSAENAFPGGLPPAPDETVEVAIVGGGISGLAAAYLLRHRNPVVFELHPRFGGNAQGGVIRGAEYTTGSAYVITPDPGSDLDTLYTDLGLHKIVRPDTDAAPVLINGELNPDIWSGLGVPPEDLPAYEAYRQLVLRMADEDYPDVPFAEPWMRELDLLSLRQHIEQEVGLPIPAPLAAAIQAYCYSSFNAGWEEISATLGWNFLAAEEYGRWIFPGGNAGLADALWAAIAPLDEADPAHAPHLRASSRVVDVRVLETGMVQVTWRTPDGGFRSLLARRVVMACPKHICRHVIHQLERLDPAKHAAMQLQTRAYVLANVVLDRPVPLDFYDIFDLGDPATFPMHPGQAENLRRYTDILDGSYAPGPRAASLPPRPSVLSLFWPLPYDTGRFHVLLDDPIERFALDLAPRLRETLALLELPESSVLEVRFARWGHALPIASIGTLASGIPEELIRPFRQAVYFVNQDNWALPAVENSLFDAFNAAASIDADLA
jgi:hypothetical protein